MLIKVSHKWLHTIFDRVVKVLTMPPQVISCQRSSPITFLSSSSPLTTSQKSILEHTIYHKYFQVASTMKVALKRKLIGVLVVILSIASLLRLLKIAIITSSSPLSSALLAKNGTYFPLAEANNLTSKEEKFLKDIISSKAPCNLLIFGNGQQYSKLAMRNKGGLTIFLDDNVNYNTYAKDAYKLLKHGRRNEECFPHNYGFDLRTSRCKLALTGLPTRIYEVTWDVVVVDGPCGHSPDCPGRMATIYTAGVLARKGNASHVIVHDVHRMIEKWFSWEFLCEDNLVSSKGKFWNFRVVIRGSNSTMFCPA